MSQPSVPFRRAQLQAQPSTPQTRSAAPVSTQSTPKATQSVTRKRQHQSSTKCDSSTDSTPDTSLNDVSSSHYDSTDNESTPKASKRQRLGEGPLAHGKLSRLEALEKQLDSQRKWKPTGNAIIDEYFQDLYNDARAREVKDNKSWAWKFETRVTRNGVRYFECNPCRFKLGYYNLH
ncbi:hypothetical protein BJ508DRAFT_335566 [Ascobolus immersus RN42]|uniref:Uncharacterized protein n=1 Tax=Ascobolus immersus RN42 TaxID=1160509 RepID=A0A3N4HE91_ASCIM|nr:hypothetical protein BJ508DRAFT_335566 [Ascobolus immersus RN42]